MPMPLSLRNGIWIGKSAAVMKKQVSKTKASKSAAYLLSDDHFFNWPTILLKRRTT